jgi:hypothetical protein
MRGWSVIPYNLMDFESVHFGYKKFPKNNAYQKTCQNSAAHSKSDVLENIKRGEKFSQRKKKIIKHKKRLS